MYTAIDLPGFGSDHGCVVHDSNVPVDGNGKPIFEEVWMYLLGDSCLPLAIEEEENKISIYPNPVKDIISIDSPNELFSVKLIDNLGRVVSVKDISGLKAELDVSLFNPGVYQVMVLTESGIVTSRILKQ